MSKRGADLGKWKQMRLRGGRCGQSIHTDTAYVSTRTIKPKAKGGDEGGLEWLTISCSFC